MRMQKLELQLWSQSQHFGQNIREISHRQPETAVHFARGNSKASETQSDSGTAIQRLRDGIDLLDFVEIINYNQTATRYSQSQQVLILANSGNNDLFRRNTKTERLLQFDQAGRVH